MTNFDQAIEQIMADDPESWEKGHRFEELLKRVLEEHPGVYGKERFSRVWLTEECPYREELGLAGDKQTGVDLVAEMTDLYGGGFCGIQAKFRKPGGNVGTEEVNSFLAELGEGFEAGLFVSTCTLPNEGLRKLRKSSPRCEVLYSQDMNSWVDDWAQFIKHPESSHIPAPPKNDPTKHPWDFQQKAIDKVVSSFKSADRGKLILPCGTGKSFVALKIAEAQAGAGDTVLYLVPSLALVRQTMLEWSQQRDIPIQYRAVCSDKKVGKKPKKAAEDMNDAGDIDQIPVPVSTNPETIRDWLSQPVPAGAMRVLFSTYQSSPKIAEAFKDSNLAPIDLIMADEAHRTTGLEGNKGHFQTCHHNSEIPARKRLYMTATPRVFTESKKAELGEEWERPDCYDMNNPVVYGETFYDELSFADAIDKGILTDYKILVIAASQEAYLQSLTRDSHDKIVAEDTELALDDAVKLAGCWDALASPDTEDIRQVPAPGALFAGGGDHARSAIAFTNRVDVSEDMAEAWPKLAEAIKQKEATRGDIEFLDIQADHVSCHTKSDDRTKAIAKLDREQNQTPQGVCHVVTNCQIFSEGVNVPSLDAVVFLNNKTSTVDITQQIGRVMRKHPGKDRGLIVIPVVVPDGASPHEKLKSGDFKTVWRVVRALKSHDANMEYLVSNATAWQSGGKLDYIDSRLDKNIKDSADSESGETAKAANEQMQMEMNRQIASKVVEACGEKQAYARWGKNAASVAKTIQTQIEDLTGENGICHAEFAEFVEDMNNAVLGENNEERQREISAQDAQQMIAQHIVTMPIFDAMLGGFEFSDNNSVSQTINKLLSSFYGKGVSFENDLRPLKYAYERMGKIFSEAHTSAERIDILREIYEGFFESAMKDIVDQLGIVYTPVEIVDFMCRSVAKICEQEFGRSLGDSSVHILDPFAGTGTFLARLLEGKDCSGNYLIPDSCLDMKYEHELHANEFILLAYYIAALKIEEARWARKEEANPGKASYLPFEKILLTDTFQRTTAIEGEQPTLAEGWERHGAGRDIQDKLPMTVIIGNPPWSAGKKKAGAGLDQPVTPKLAKRIEETYVAKHIKVTGEAPGGKAAGNLYLRAIRWATDRILPDAELGRADLPAIVAFVHPNSLTDGTSLVGLRATLREEFTSLYVVNLLGDTKKDWKLEGDKVFGAKSQNGVQISVFVRNPKQIGEPAELKYIEVPATEYFISKGELMPREAKLQWLEELGDVTSPQLEEIPVNKYHDWREFRDPTYEDLMPVCFSTRGKKKYTEDVAASVSARGVTTACDPWAYAWDRETLELKIQELLERYQNALDDLLSDSPTKESKPSDDHLKKLMKDYRIDGVAKLKDALKKREAIDYEPWRIRHVLYRPFTKLWLYEDARILSSVNTVSKMFPRGEQIEGIEVTAGSNNSSTDSVLAVDGMADLNSIGPARGGGASLSESGDINNEREQHDFPGTRDEQADRSGDDQRIATDQGSSQDEVVAGGGGHTKQLSSQHRPTKRSSEFSRPGSSATYARPAHNKPAEPSRDPANSPSKHGNIQRVSHKNPTRPTQHSSRPTNPNPPPNHQITREENSKILKTTPGAEAIYISSPSNTAIFTALASNHPGDLKAAGISQANRALPRHQAPS